MLRKYNKRFKELDEQALKVSKTEDINSGLILNKLSTFKYEDIVIRDEITDRETLNFKNFFNGLLKLGTEKIVDKSLYNKWCLNVLNLLKQACGKDSDYYQRFSDLYEEGHLHTASQFQEFRTLFEAAKDDYTGGYIIPTETLVHAEVFDEQLEQATELLKKGYYIPAAVCAGVVLETALFKLCQQNNISRGTLDTMNIELTKIEVYSKLEQKKITALAHIRNCAAHGNFEEINKSDVKNMLNDVNKFVSSIFINN